MDTQDQTQILTKADREQLKEMLHEDELTINTGPDLDLGAYLIKAQLIDESQLREALNEQTETGHQERLGEILIRRKVISEAHLLEALAKHLGLRFVRSINDREIPEELLKKIPTRFAKKFQILPVGVRGKKVEVVCADPLNTAAIDDVQILLERPVRIAVCPTSVITEAINRSYDRISTADQAVEEFDTEVLDENVLNEPVDLLDTEDEAPIIRLVNSILFRSVKERASDIHVEPYEREVSVRFRIDGDLYDILKVPKRIQNSFTSRIKLIGGLNIAEKRLPQDGRIRIKIAGKDIDLRLSTIPTAHGERIVMRLLDKGANLLDLKHLGFADRMLKNIHELIAKPYGILLVTGPTGSGKTTTLYACLSNINREDINIITVEDPIEYQIPGIGQIQTNDKIGLTFASGLRSILRQDPDVILIGEIRDKETAEIAVQASLTGHLVLSSIHTNDACSCVARLVDMGIEPFLVASSLVGILAQRLVRQVCSECRELIEPTQEQLARINLERLPAGSTVYRHKGCERCHYTGYTGRVGIFELLPIDENLRSIILKHSDSVSIKKAAMAQGFQPMRIDGIRKVLSGVTTIEEVLAVTAEDSRMA
ncbi:MAG: type II secretion system protein GspE [Deltaproteobacteria bacterium CG11_big_fil_rev_8_21_14_0_20_45_16]|nr:MAG: type II secretion system protein GspE [Deltaproteobacteria bacterium CG11_big_fil_rev_8_21_14_0_20_45_16]